MQGYTPIPEMELIGIISHQGTKDNDHYSAMTKKEEEWTLYNDAATTHITTTHMHQMQAYILIYRKTPEISIRTPPGQNLPCSERRDEGPDPSQAERPPIEQQRGMKIPANTHDYTPIATGTEEGVDGDGTRGGGDENTPPPQNGRGTRATFPADRKFGPTP